MYVYIYTHIYTLAGTRRSQRQKEAIQWLGLRAMLRAAWFIYALLLL